MNVAGQWSGMLIYGRKYGALRGRKLYFEMDIHQDSDQITGEAKDISGVGMNPDHATISGTYTNKTISFTKQYKSYHYYKNGKAVIDKSRRGNEILYSGEYDEDEQAFKGSWMITDRWKLFGIITFTYRAEGTWMMRRNDFAL